MAAFAAKAQYFFSGSVCKHGHCGLRYTTTGGCVSCARLRAEVWATANKERVVAAKQKYAAQNRQLMNQRIKQWKLAKPDKVNAATAKRRAQKLRALPKWVDTKQLDSFYKQAQTLTRQTQQPHHVDHIVPLQNPNVCGLHVPWNLQVILAEDNLRKSNSWVDNV